MKKRILFAITVLTALTYYVTFQTIKLYIGVNFKLALSMTFILTLLQIVGPIYNTQVKHQNDYALDTKYIINWISYLVFGITSSMAIYILLIDIVKIGSSLVFSTSVPDLLFFNILILWTALTTIPSCIRTSSS